MVTRGAVYLTSGRRLTAHQWQTIQSGARGDLSTRQIQGALSRLGMGVSRQTVTDAMRDALGVRPDIYRVAPGHRLGMGFFDLQRVGLKGQFGVNVKVNVRTTFGTIEKRFVRTSFDRQPTRSELEEAVWKGSEGFMKYPWLLEIDSIEVGHGYRRA